MDCMDMCYIFPHSLSTYSLLHCVHDFITSVTSITSITLLHTHTHTLGMKFVTCYVCYVCYDKRE